MMTSSAESVLDRAGLAARDVTHFIPHQANARMMATVAHQLAIAPEQMLSTIAQFANSSAATTPFTLSMSAKRAALQKGRHRSYDGGRRRSDRRRRGFPLVRLLPDALDVQR